MRIHRLRSHQELVDHRRRNADHEQAQLRHVESLVPADGVSAFTVPGFSYPAREKVDFLVDFKYAATGRINWRERAICPITGLSNRMRATVHLFDIEMDVYSDTRIYLTEQVTPIYRYFAKTFENVCGSEFLGQKVNFGETDQSGIRNENLCSLSFPEASFDAIISLDVLEHIPNFLDAFRECYRCLRPGGKLMWSAPFAPNSESNIVRAVQNEDGTVTHLLDPEYHGDPISSEGVLCYTHFGWEVIAQLRSLGFRDAYAIPYQSVEFGYFGNETLLFFAVK